MKIRTIFLLFVLILMAVFLVINWTALSTVTAVNLIYTEIQAPLGVLVVGGFAAVVFVLLVYMVWQQASVTLELRAAYKEARNARTVADDAEKSRFAESNRILLERIEKLEALMTARSDETLTAVRQEAVRAEERYKALFDDQKRAQGELTAQVQTQIGAMEKRVVETLPSAVSAAVPTQEAPRFFGVYPAWAEAGIIRRGRTSRARLHRPHRGRRPRAGGSSRERCRGCAGGRSWRRRRHFP